MTGLVATDPQAPTVPRVTWSLPEAGTERLLVVGGFYQRMDRCPRFGCLAWVMARDGTVSHSWEVDPHELWQESRGSTGSVRAENIYPVGAALGPDGHLVLTFDGRNLSLSGRHRQAVSRRPRNLETFHHAHHWIDIDAAGRIFAPSMEIRKNVDFAGNTAVDISVPASLQVSITKVYGPTPRTGRCCTIYGSWRVYLSLAIRGSSTDCGTAATHSTSIQSRSSTPRSLRTFPVWRPATFSFQFASLGHRHP